MKKLWIFAIIGIPLVITGLYILGHIPNTLDHVRMDQVNVVPGDSLISVCLRIETSIRLCGDPWTVAVGANISDRVSHSSFSGGGSKAGYADFSYYVAREYGCHCMVIELSLIHI